MLRANVRRANVRRTLFSNREPRTANRDDDRFFTLSETSGLTTTEAGGTDTFTVVLDVQPTADVTVALTSNRPEAAPSPASLTFTSANWDVVRTVTVTGQNDALYPRFWSQTIRWLAGREKQTERPPLVISTDRQPARRAWAAALANTSSPS